VLQDFDPFCPKALAGIGKVLHDTVDDRCLKIELERQSREERAERFRKREVRKGTESLRAELEALEQDKTLIEKLRDARPILPEELNDRQQEICEPLLAIADMAGMEWSQKARAALIKVSAQEEDASLGVKLLAAIQSIFDQRKADKLATDTILRDLVAIEDGPWALMFEDALKHERLHTAGAKLARVLKKYKKPDGDPIKPHVVRIGDETPRGFCREDFEQAWKLYISSPSPLPGKAATGATGATYEGKNVAPGGSVAPEAATNIVAATDLARNVADVAAVAPFRGIGHRRANCVADGGPPCTYDGPLCDACEQFRKESKDLFPGGWLFFRNAPDFRAFYGDQLPLSEKCIGLEDSPEIIEHDACLTSPSCGCNPAEQPDGFYYHPTRQVARCCDYQHAAWWAQGFDVLNGFPFGDWEATTEERLAEQERNGVEEAERCLARRLATREGRAWLTTPEGRTWQKEQEWTPDWRVNAERELRKRKPAMTAGEFLAGATVLFNAKPVGETKTNDKTNE